MRQKHSYKVVRQRRIVRGQGIKDNIIEFGRKGVRFLRYQTINGVRKLVPYAVRGSSSLAKSGIDSLADVLHSKLSINAPRVTQAVKDTADSLMHSVGDMLDDKLRSKMGGAVRPGRNLLLREINHSLTGGRVRKR